MNQSLDAVFHEISDAYLKFRVKVTTLLHIIILLRNRKHVLCFCKVK